MAAEATLAEAQALGYAEADPSFDVEGLDTAHKLAILTSVAFGTEIDRARALMQAAADSLLGHDPGVVGDVRRGRRGEHGRLHRRHARPRDVARGDRRLRFCAGPRWEGVVAPAC